MVAARTMFTTSARSNVGGMDHAGQCGVKGQGRTTDHQKSSEPEKNITCSTPCQNGTRSASWYGPGKCQPHVATAMTARPTPGCARRCAPCRSRGQARNGPRASRTIRRGNPRNRGTIGAPRRISGGATDVSTRCCVMWAVRNRPERTSSGEAAASQSDVRPAEKQTRRHLGSTVSCRCQSRRHPRK